MNLYLISRVLCFNKIKSPLKGSYSAEAENYKRDDLLGNVFFCVLLKIYGVSDSRDVHVIALTLLWINTVFYLVFLYYKIFY